MPSCQYACRVCNRKLTKNIDKFFKIAFLLVLTLYLSACSFGGKSGVFPRATIGVPTRWLIHEEITGTVVDIASCKDLKVDGASFSFTQSLCLPVVKAEVTLVVDAYPDSENKYRYTTRTDDKGNFRFKRRTELHFVSTGGNAYNSGVLTVTANGYVAATGRLSWDFGFSKPLFMHSMESLENLRAPGHMVVIVNVEEYQNK